MDKDLKIVVEALAEDIINQCIFPSDTKEYEKIITTLIKKLKEAKPNLTENFEAIKRETFFTPEKLILNCMTLLIFSSIKKSLNACEIKQIVLNNIFYVSHLLKNLEILQTHNISNKL